MADHTALWTGNLAETVVRDTEEGVWEVVGLADDGWGRHSRFGSALLSNLLGPEGVEALQNRKVLVGELISVWKEDVIVADRTGKRTFTERVAEILDAVGA
jgi:hypothetical protein